MATLAARSMKSLVDHLTAAKTLRGSAPRSAPEQVTAARRGAGPTHLVAGYDQVSGVTFGQLACSPEAGKGGEVAVAEELAAALDQRGLLADAVITGDAGFTAREQEHDHPGDHRPYRVATGRLPASRAWRGFLPGLFGPGIRLRLGWSRC